MLTSPIEATLPEHWKDCIAIYPTSVEIIEEALEDVGVTSLKRINDLRKMFGHQPETEDKQTFYADPKLFTQKIM